ncbi:RNase adapter RapZ [Elstera cyanobacteriorum]|uniref:RNase adapter RapZ n=1 Tax=Elstera cyanobacteriorum TaxID=2022747 RepID=UPI002352DB6A|nr:RNase adapter RapZ [Elstera cyanobacteriorum]MCK6441294.1 RNase adapter RapZ [Elstera cyanobacteriorum]
MSGKESPILVVSGMSGAGKSTALRALEDIGFEAVDNLPLPLLPMVAQLHDRIAEPLAIGIDIRTRGFSVDELLLALDGIETETGTRPQLVFLDCDDDALVRRFTETRRRHPLAADRPAADGIALERMLIGPLRQRADDVIDTTVLAPGEFRRLMQELVQVKDGRSLLTVTVLSFSFRQGLPREADLVFDVRFLKNPYYDLALRPFDGRTQGVADHIRQDPDFAPFFENLKSLLKPLLPRYQDEGKSYLTIAFGCTGGKHRSVFLAEQTAAWLSAEGWDAGIHHRELKDNRPARGRRDTPAPPTPGAPS